MKHLVSHVLLTSQLRTTILGIVRMLVSIPHVHKHHKKAAILRLLAIITPYRTKKRFFEARLLKVKMYHVLLQYIRSKLVSCHPDGFMNGHICSMPYVKSSFMAVE